MMSSRSIIWTLTHQDVPTPPDDIRQAMATDLLEALPRTFGKSFLKRTKEAADPASLFSHRPVPRLTPPGPKDYPDPLLEALLNLTRGATKRHRSVGRAPVRQQVSPEFVGAALSQWARNDDDRQSRVELLRNTDILDRLSEKGFLTDVMRQQLGDSPDRWPRPEVPADFCDDGKNGLDLGLGPDMGGVRKVCYGVFGLDFPASALKATNPKLWSKRCPDFWLRSDVAATKSHRDATCEYQAGLLIEEVNLPNVLHPFGPVALTFVRTTALDKTWSYVTYKLVNDDVVKVDEGWYLVQRRPDSANAAIMVKAIEFYGDNDWLDSVCEAGLLDGARTLLGIDKGAARRAPGSPPAFAGPVTQQKGGQDGVLAGVLTKYLDERRREWDVLGTKNLNEVKAGLTEFESKPLRFGWVDNVFNVIENATSFASTAASNWADVVQQDLPDALNQVDATTTDKETTPAYLLAAGWKTALGAYKVGSDISRAMLQLIGPGIGKRDTTMVEGLNDLQQSGRLPEFLQSCGVTDIPTARQKLFNHADRSESVTGFAADLDSVLQIYGKKPPKSAKRMAFAQEVWDRGRSSRRRTAGS